MKKWMLRLGLLLVGGLCGCESAGPSVAPMVAEKVTPELQLQWGFEVGRQTDYRLSREYTKEVRWEGVPADKADQLRDARTSTRLRLGFIQEVMAVDPNGFAELRITLTDLAYYVEVSSQVKVDFDSQRPADANQVLMTLVGGSYTIGLRADGKVTEVTGREALLARITEESALARIARRLCETSVIRKRHSLPMLAGRSQTQHKLGDQWRLSTLEDFQEMGKKSYYKVYTLAEVEDKRAVITLETEPSTRGVHDESSGAETPNPFSAMMDNEEQFSGRWVWDGKQGEVESGHEELKVTWRVAGTNQRDPDAVPIFTIMTALRGYRLERMD